MKLYSVDVEKQLSAIKTINVFAASEHEARQRAEAQARTLRWGSKIKDELFIRNIEVIGERI